MLDFVFQLTDLFLKASPTPRAKTMSIRATSSQKVCKRLSRLSQSKPFSFGRFHGHSERMVGLQSSDIGTCRDCSYDRAVLHDPELYPEPEAFKPERFLDEDGTFRDDPVITLAFDAGRRICPGRHFVAATLFVVTASVLSVFDVTRAKDKDGNEIPVAASTTPVPGEIVM
jgi:hypothetical protein